MVRTRSPGIPLNHADFTALHAIAERRLNSVEHAHRSAFHGEFDAGMRRKNCPKWYATLLSGVTSYLS